MKNNTQSNILKFISQTPSGVSANDIIGHFKLNATGVFRHLKKMQELGEIYKVGKPPKVIYYPYYKNMEGKSEVFTNIFNWAVNGDGRLLHEDTLCATRNVFQARSERILNDLIKLKGEQTAYLLLAIIGEIGFNSFDHNIGNWRDTMGVIFSANMETREIILSDRGQGVLATISRVRPNTTDDTEALNIAFTEIISGRYPEQRGNGLKYVKKIVMENNLYLEFYSGKAQCTITANGIKISKNKNLIPGTLVLIKF